MKQLLTYSRMQSFKTCRKKHYWEYEVGIRRECDSKALRMGTAGHMALDVLNRSKSSEEAEALTEIQTYYSICPATVDPYEWEIERETIECLIAGYAWRWKNVDIEILSSEQQFQLPLLNQTTGACSTIWELAGKIDGIVCLEDGRKAVMEHKFISDPIDDNSDFWKRLQIDNQISLYLYAARKLHDDQVQTVVYDVIRKPTIRPEQVPILDSNGLKIVLDAAGNRVLTKQGKPRQTADTASGYVLQTRKMTPKEWEQKLLDDIGKRPEYYYARREIARLDSEIDEMMAEIWDIQKTIRDAQIKDRWYRTVSKDTCTWCPYFELCSSHYVPESTIPEGFIKLENLHPELEMEKVP